MIRRFVPECAGPSAPPSTELAERFERAARLGGVRLDERYLFVGGPLQIRYVPLQSIVWGYLRQEDSSASVCCGRTSIPSYFLMIVTEDGQTRKIPMESPATVQSALDGLHERNPSMAVGYCPQHEQAIRARQTAQPQS